MTAGQKVYETNALFTRARIAPTRPLPSPEALPQHRGDMRGAHSIIRNVRPACRRSLAPHGTPAAGVKSAVASDRRPAVHHHVGCSGSFGRADGANRRPTVSLEGRRPRRATLATLSDHSSTCGASTRSGTAGRSDRAMRFDSCLLAIELSTARRTSSAVL